MADKQDIQDQIERYVWGEMPAEESAAFARTMETDPDLKKAVENFRALQADLQLVDEDGFRGKMTGWAAEMRGVEAEESQGDRDGKAGTAKPGPVRSFRWWYAAAAALLLLLVPTLLLLRDQGDSALFDEYFSPYADVTSGRGSEDEAFQSGLAHYNAEEYSEAVSDLNRYLETVPGDQDALFYAGLSELAGGNAATGIQRLEALRKQSGIYDIAATWYQALGHLRMGEKGKARSLLQDLADKENSYRDESRELLEKMK